jgi:hypothetical protein
MGMTRPSSPIEHAEPPLDSAAISRGRAPHRRYQGPEEAAPGNGRSAWRLIVRPLHFTQARLDSFLSATVFLGFFALFLLKAPGLDYFLTSRDHAYQLSVGTQVLMGKVPGIDILMAYGPMAMYTSALGLWASDSLIGETIMCAAGYALCLFLIFRMVAVYSSRTMGLAAAFVAFLLQARFYKWYVWLFPLMACWALNRYQTSSERRRSFWAVGSGLIVGVGWLFRLDMGTLVFATCVVWMAVIEAGWPARNIGRAVRAVGLLSAGFSITVLAWFGYLAIKVGAHAPFQFVSSTIDGALTIAAGMALPLPPIRSVVLGYVLLPATLLFGAVIALYRERSGRPDARSRFLLAVSLVGLAIFHQAMHRRGPGHLLQVVPAGIVSAFIIAAIFRDRLAVMSIRNARDWALAGSALAYFLLLGLDVKGLSKWGRQDLIGLTLWPAERFVDLIHPLAASDRFPAIKAMLAIQEQTNPQEPILVFPLDSQFYAIAQRRLSGRVYAFYEGVFDAPRYRAQNIASIRNEMPALVVLPSGFQRHVSESAPDDLETNGRRAHQYLEEFIHQEYTRVVYDDGRIVLLKR